MARHKRVYARTDAHQSLGEDIDEETGNTGYEEADCDNSEVEHLIDVAIEVIPLWQSEVDEEVQDAIDDYNETHGIDD